MFDARPGAVRTVREAERKSGRIKARRRKRRRAGKSGLQRAAFRACAARGVPPQTVEKPVFSSRT